MTIGPAYPVDAPPASPPLHSLLVSAQPVTEPNDRWTMGFEFEAETCGRASAWNPDCSYPQILLPHGGERGVGERVELVAKSTPVTGGGDGVTYQPFIVEASFECQPLIGEAELRRRARVILDASTSHAMEYEFWTGAVNPANLHLADSSADVLGGGTATDPAHALALLNEYLAECGAGSRGMIHAPVRAATLMSTDGMLTTEGQRLVTVVNRNIVVSGGGYPGTDRDGNPPATDQQWVYATGLVYLRMSDPFINPDDIAQAMNRQNNRVRFTAERYVAPVWDGCCLGAVLVDTSATSVPG